MSTAIQTPIPAANTAVQAFVIDADHSDVGFSVRHMLSRTRGRFARFSGTIQICSRCTGSVVDAFCSLCVTPVPALMR